VRKSRFFYLHPEANAGKIAALDALQEEYAAYLNTCVQAMLAARRFSVPLKEQREFFPARERLSSQIAKSVRAHAVAIVSGWASSNYAVKLKKHIASQLREELIDEPTGIALYTIGKHSVNRPSERGSQEALDLYWSWLLDESVVGRKPTISARCGNAHERDDLRPGAAQGGFPGLLVARLLSPPRRQPTHSAPSGR
jgi:hypothetical protein